MARKKLSKAIYGEIYRYVGHRCIIHGALGADPIHSACDSASTGGGPVRRKRSTERESSQPSHPVNAIAARFVLPYCVTPVTPSITCGTFAFKGKRRRTVRTIYQLARNDRVSWPVWIRRWKPRDRLCATIDARNDEKHRRIPKWADERHCFQ